MKTTKEVLAESFRTTADDLQLEAHCRVSSALRAMETYADPFKAALQEIVDELQGDYKSRCDEADWFNNNTDGVGQTIDYRSRPAMPPALKIALEALK